MQRKEKNIILKQAKILTNEELEDKYYEAVYESLGSLTEDMYEYGYDMCDIEERRKYEKYLSEKANILEMLCIKRGIKLWEK